MRVSLFFVSVVLLSLSLCLSLPLSSSGDDSVSWDVVVQSLNGPGWVLENHNRTIRLSNVTVPGSVWTALFSDPLYDDIELLNQWIVSEPYWHYSLVFAPNQSMWFDYVTWHYELVVEGIDTLGRIEVNGLVVGSTDNMHRRYVFSVPLLDNSQFNRIDIYLYPVRPVIEAAAAGYPYPIPVIDPMTIESNRSFIRKAVSDFGWDFAPHFQSMGINGRVEFRAYNQAWIQDVTVRQIFETEATQKQKDTFKMKQGDVILNVTAFVRTPPERNSSGIIKVQLESQNTQMAFAVPASPRGNGDYLSPFSQLLMISQPALWYPAGYGAQPLYTLTVTYNGSFTGIQTAHQVTRRIGVRQVKVVRAVTGSSPGLSFQFVVNGVNIFVKGANLTPFDPFHSRVTVANMTRILQAAINSNMNMLRIWGGGIYQPTELYDFADEHGLLIWTEFAFACDMVPVSSSMLTSIREEAAQQVRRIGSHASVAIFSGNNENEEALTWFDSTKNNRDRYIVDYSRLYINTIRDALFRELGLDVEYVASSPSNGPLSLDPFVLRYGDPNNYTYGDIHFYPDPNTNDFADVGTYPRARFVSEYGLPSFSSALTMSLSAPNPAIDIHINSTWMKQRQRYGANNWITEVNYLEVSKHFNLPTVDPIKNPNQYYDDFVYLSQANQALAYSTAIESMRRQKSEPPSYTSGIMFWQLVDIV